MYATPHIGRLANLNETIIQSSGNVAAERDPYLIDTNSPFTVISNDEYELFVHYIAQTGAMVRTDTIRETVAAVVVNCNEIMHQLPLISFTMFDSQNRPLVQFVMAPEDYIPDRESCALTIRGTSLPRNVAFSDPRLGDNFLRNIHVLFSASQNLVGFCDPL